jgi:transcriptional repressor NrdR
VKEMVPIGGMYCPSCGCPEHDVLETRNKPGPCVDGTAKMGKIRRRRQCQHCGRRFTTFEEIAW